jgi:hypothetical protein
MKLYLEENVEFFDKSKKQFDLLDTTELIDETDIKNSNLSKKFLIDKV